MGAYLKRPRFRDRIYRTNNVSKAVWGAQVPAHFCSLQDSTKASRKSRPSVSDSDLFEQEAQLKKIDAMLSYQDWFLAAAMQEVSTALQSAKAGSGDVVLSLQNALDFFYSTSRANYDTRDHALHLLYNTTLRRRDAYLADTFPQLRSSLKRDLRSYHLRDSLLFSEVACQSTLRRYSEASSATLLTQATQRHPKPGRPAQNHQRGRDHRPAAKRRAVSPPKPRKASFQAGKPRKANPNKRSYNVKYFSCSKRRPSSQLTPLLQASTAAFSWLQRKTASGDR